MEEYTKHEKIRLPPEICAMAKGAWTHNLRSVRRAISHLSLALVNSFSCFKCLMSR